MSINFREASLDDSFAKLSIEAIKGLIERSVSFTLSGMPGVGGSIFLRFLASRSFANFVYLDTYQLGEIDKLSFYKLLLESLGGEAKSLETAGIFKACLGRLSDLVRQEKKLVIIFNRFDQLGRILDDNLFTDLINLHNVGQGKVVFIFTANRLDNLSAGEISADKINLLSKVVYLKPFLDEDLKKLIKLSAQESFYEPDFIERAIALSGGHYQLLQLLLKSERLELPFIDPFVRHQLKEVYGYLSYTQRKQLEKIALGRNLVEIDLYLVSVGIVRKTDRGLTLFTPLFADYISENIAHKFSFKENKLFNLLKKNLGKVVLSEDIFERVWGGSGNEVSDWALSSLLYRLKKHPLVKNGGYIIENYKKSGYRMIKN